jgi:thioredoxin reductase
MRDVIIIGGSFAGLTAALQLGRGGRAVTVVDAGAPRNRMSPAAHGLPGWDGAAPADILAGFRADLLPYASVEIVGDTVAAVPGAADAFRADLASGAAIGARRVLLAHGVRDLLPDLPGAAEAWGRGLLHCPYCHGHEVRGRPLAVLGTHPMSAQQAAMLRADWSEDVTLLASAGAAVDLHGLDPEAVRIDPRPVSALGSVPDGIGVRYADGTVAEFAAVSAAPRVDLSGTQAAGPGCATTEGPLGPFLRVGPQGQTGVPGVFAAGGLARPAHGVTLSMGDGAAAGTGCHQSPVFPGLIQPVAAAA